MEVTIMVAINEMSWDDIFSPDFGTPARQAWRAAVAEVARRQVQLTLRDMDETQLLARLEAVLQRFPVAAKPVDTTPQWPLHGVPRRQNHCGHSPHRTRPSSGHLAS